MVLINEAQLLLDEYCHRINSTLKTFSALFGNENPVKLWRQGLVERVGYLDDKNQVQYSFHGAGCTIEFESGEIVSFDFLEDGAITFDLFKFQCFVLSRKSVAEGIANLFDGIELYNENGKWKIKEARSK